jgi:hypothetical protein
MSFAYGLANNAPDKFKVLQMLLRIRLATLGTRVERDPIALHFEELIARVKDFLRKGQEKLPRDTTGIDPWLILEYYFDRLLDLFRRELTELLIRSQEDILPINPYLKPPHLQLRLLFQLYVEVCSLVLKREEVGHPLNDVFGLVGGAG